ncbi:MAG: ribonuclease R [Gammaproteobacteria bacterium]|nr:ribonuclease R [Gammaproteobacteria bacterium]
MSTQSRHGRKATSSKRRTDNSIPARSKILDYLAQRGEPLSFAELVRGMGIKKNAAREAVAGRLGVMERDGQVLKNRGGAFGLPRKMDLIRGRVQGHADGYGFVIPDDGQGDLYLPPRSMRKVLHGDYVIAAVTGVDRSGRRKGSVVEVIERRHQKVVGRYFNEDGASFVVPDDARISQNIFIPPHATLSAGNGQIVTAELVDQPTQRRQPVGNIVEILGDHLAPGMESEIAIRKYELPCEWPQAVEREAHKLPKRVSPADLKGREDLRNLPLVTIDGEDARDFDDAVYCERSGKGWRLIVAIADVSHYVRPVDSLDNEAFARGNSVYFPNRVIPMLPEALSNELCSLKPECDRLSLACEMDIGPRGKVKNYRFFDAVIHSHARLTYNQAAAMLIDRDAALLRQFNKVVASLEQLNGVYQALRSARSRRGSIDFDLPETRIYYDEEGRIESIRPLERNDAHRLIEECMIAANISAAECLATHEQPALYRVHDTPNPDELTDLRRSLAEFSMTLSGGDRPSALDYAKVLTALQNRPELRRLIQTMLLRSLSEACYRAEKVGHFALACDLYTHFTSPIRRYPDLLVHRAIKRIVVGQSPKAEEGLQLSQQAEHCSMTERRADDASRDVMRWLKAEYMQDRIGEVYQGVITGVTNFGLFVELIDVFVEGLVHVTSLGNDYYHFDPLKFRLAGERSGVMFRLGDNLRVRVMSVNLDEAKIDFELEDKPKPGVQGLNRRKRSKGRKRARR